MNGDETAYHCKKEIVGNLRAETEINQFTQFTQSVLKKYNFYLSAFVDFIV